MNRILKNTAVFILLGLSSFLLQAQERAKVTSSRPLTHQITGPQQICGMTPMTIVEPKTGAGAMLGAIAGGVVGSAVGQGGGNAAATALGIMGGAVAGDVIEGQGSHIQNVTTCSVQMVSRNITVYNVEYEYAGKRYFVQLPNDPGKFISVDVSPSVPGSQVSTQSLENYDAGSAQLGGVITYPSAPPPVYVQPYPYVYPPPYGYGYVPSPFLFQFGFGYHGTYHHR